MLLLSSQELDRLQRRKRSRRAKRMKPIKPPADVQRDFERRMKRLWKQVLEPATNRIVDAIRAGVSPAVLADMIEQVHRQAQFEYDMAANDIVLQWSVRVDRGVRAAIQRGMSGSLGIDISGVLDAEPIKSALAMSVVESAGLIKSIPAEFLGKVARAVSDNFRGVPLPEGRSLQQQIQHLGGVTTKRARLIARDQTSKLTGALNQARQQSIGVEEYIWRTVKDRRVVGNPAGIYPKGNSKHMDHHERHGKKFRWDSPPPDGHPGQPIQCRCYADPVIDVKKILASAQEV